mgnify:CR=1 FL=1
MASNQPGHRFRPLPRTLFVFHFSPAFTLGAREAARWIFARIFSANWHCVNAALYSDSYFRWRAQQSNSRFDENVRAVFFVLLGGACGVWALFFFDRQHWVFAGESVFSFSLYVLAGIAAIFALHCLRCGDDDYRLRRLPANRRQVTIWNSSFLDW